MNEIDVTVTVHVKHETGEAASLELSRLTNQSYIYVAVTIISVLAFIGLVKLGIKMYRRSQRHPQYSATKSRPVSQSFGSSSDPQMPSIFEITSILVGNTGGTTSAVGKESMSAVALSHGASIPALLELQWNVDFRQEDQIAKGDRCSIYHASALQFDLSERSQGAPLALKQYNDESLDVMQPKFRGMFLQELAMLWKWRHQTGVAKVYGYSVRPVTVVMKFYVLGDLDQYSTSKKSASSKRYPYTRLKIIQLMRQWCETMEFLHKIKLVNRDLKPANVLLENGNNGELIPVIADFGLARDYSGDSKLATMVNMADLRTGSMAYVAPEVLVRLARQDEGDLDTWKAADVYSLALSLYQLLERTQPWLPQKK